MPSMATGGSCNPGSKLLLRYFAARATDLAHEQIGVSPTDGQSPIRAENAFLLGKPSNISQKETLDDTPSEWCRKLSRQHSLQ